MTCRYCSGHEGRVSHGSFIGAKGAWVIGAKGAWVIGAKGAWVIAGVTRVGGFVVCSIPLDPK